MKGLSLFILRLLSTLSLIVERTSSPLATPFDIYLYINIYICCRALVSHEEPTFDFFLSFCLRRSRLGGLVVHLHGLSTRSLFLSFGVRPTLFRSLSLFLSLSFSPFLSHTQRSEREGERERERGRERNSGVRRTPSSFLHF